VFNLLEKLEEGLHKYIKDDEVSSLTVNKFNSALIKEMEALSQKVKESSV